MKTIIQAAHRRDALLVAATMLAAFVCAFKTFLPHAQGRRLGTKPQCPLKFSPDDKLLVCVSEEGQDAITFPMHVGRSLQVWDVAGGQCVGTLAASVDSAVRWTADFASDGALWTFDGHTVNRYDPASRVASPFPGVDHPLGNGDTFAVFPDGTSLHWFRWNDYRQPLQVQVREAPTGRKIAEWECHGRSQVAMSPAGRLIAIGDYVSHTKGAERFGSRLRLWDWRRDPEPTLLSDCESKLDIQALRFSSDGATLAAERVRSGLNLSGEIQLWDVATRRKRSAIEVSGLRNPLDDLFHSSFFGGDGKQLFVQPTISRHGAAYDVAPAPPRKLFEFGLFDGLSKDGTLLATCDR